MLVNPLANVDGAEHLKKSVLGFFQLRDVTHEDEIFEKLRTVILQAVELRISDELNDEAFEELETSLEKSNDDEASYREILRARFPEARRWTFEEVVRIRAALPLPLMSRQAVEETPEEVALNDAVKVGGDTVSQLSGSPGLVFDLVALLIGLGFDPAHHKRTESSKRRWRLKKVISWIAELGAVLWFDLMVLVVAFHLQRRGTIGTIPNWIVFWVPGWFLRRGFVAQALLTLTAPAIAVGLIGLVILLFYRKEREKSHM